MKLLQIIAAILAGIIVAIFVTIFSGYARSATVVFPKGSVAVEVQLDAGEDCGVAWAIVCLTSLAKQRAYLLAITDDTEFLWQAYRLLFRRQIDAPGLAWYKDQLARRLITRDQVINNIVATDEYKRLHP